MLFNNDNPLYGKIPVKTPIPTRNEIVKRFLKTKFPTTTKYLIQSILTPCAEEAEKMMEEVFFHRVSPVKIDCFTTPRKTSAVCPSCNGNSIESHHKYCHHCGSPILWISNRDPKNKRN